ncbi:MAG: N-acetyl-gamma-glutamyl-phosphate reductase [Treponema sp.]|jgi:N-acetyl-gamma-glutamyl-phosphate reductase|nr:N-acetyl-gamma-glutamyl-phosphate reductase [Treponema sp.]
MLNIGVLGATGYAGAEVTRILLGHPQTAELHLSSVSFEGDALETVYPNFLGHTKKIIGGLKKAEESIEAADVVFACLPHGVGEDFAKSCVEKGKPFIDLSADFRFGADERTFAAWYGTGYRRPELRRHSVYGLPEINREAARRLAASGAVIVGNPGCYPTAATLGALPALARGLAGDGAVIVDAVSGVTGGGREPARAYHYPECADNVSPYKVGCHRHTPEISRNFAVASGLANGAPRPVVFTPHLAPVNRGILATIYIPLADAPADSGDPSPAFPPKETAPRPPSKEINAKAEAIHAVYAEFYQGEPFVRVLPFGAAASTNRVRQSNYCDISVHLDQSGSTLIIASAIDNMVKGAAGQAVQNMNIIFGFEETAGLTAIPALF